MSEKPVVHRSARARTTADDASATGRDRSPRAQLLLAAGQLVACFVVLTAVWVGLGLLITKPLASTSVGAADHQVAAWFVDHRTPVLNDLTKFGSLLGQTVVKLVVSAILSVVAWLLLRSWRAPLLIWIATLLEGAVFITTTSIVSRPRPDVASLESVTVNSSFPSGHSGAAAAYAAVVFVVFAYTRTWWIRTVTVVLAAAVPLIVGISRMYRGAHYLTDVLAGILLGLACVVAVYLVLTRTFGRLDRPRTTEMAGRKTANRE